jgi:hypothetical protein
MRRRAIALAVSSVLHLIALVTLAIVTAAPRVFPPAPRLRGMSVLIRAARRRLGPARVAAA